MSTSNFSRHTSRSCKLGLKWVTKMTRYSVRAGPGWGAHIQVTTIPTWPALLVPIT